MPPEQPPSGRPPTSGRHPDEGLRPDGGPAAPSGTRPARADRMAALGELRRDPFFDDFFTRIPRETWPSFSEDQLYAIKRAFGARYRGAHLVDLRLSLPVPFRRMYMVLLVGGEKRSRARRHSDRRRQPMVTLGNLVFAAIFFGLLLMSLLGLLYLLKSWIGIDLVPGASLGLWESFSGQVRETFR